MTSAPEDHVRAAATQPTLALEALKGLVELRRAHELLLLLAEALVDVGSDGIKGDLDVGSSLREDLLHQALELLLAATAARAHAGDELLHVDEACLRIHSRRVGGSLQETHGLLHIIGQ